MAEEVVDPLPVLVLGEYAGCSWRSALVGAAPAEGGVARAAVPRLACGMPMIERLYLAAGMPAAASRSISRQMLSILRSFKP
jgi:hypothetical protein